MALLFFTGFENEDGYEADTNRLIQSATQKRTGSYSGLAVAAYPYLHVNYSGSEKTFIFGAAMYINVGGGYCCFHIENAYGPQCTVQLVGAVTGSGRAYIRRGGSGGTVIGTGTKAIYSSTWYYVEAKIFINNTTGSAIVNIDEVEDINISGQDTQFQATDDITILYAGLNANTGSSYFYIDDLYMCDTSGSINNDFLGPVMVEGLTPSGNGYNSDFVGSDADSVDNYLLVDEVPANDDTDYIKSDVVSDIDSFAYGNLTGDIGTIHGIKINSVAKKEDTYDRNFKNFVRVSGTNYLSSEYDPDTSYNNFFTIWEQNPDTATGWTESDVNAIEAGITISS